MSRKHTIANKAKWAKIPKEIRSKRMSELAKIKHKNMSIEDRLKLGRELNNKRWNKKKEEKN